MHRYADVQVKWCSKCISFQILPLKTLDLFDKEILRFYLETHSTHLFDFEGLFLLLTRIPGQKAQLGRWTLSEACVTSNNTMHQHRYTLTYSIRLNAMTFFTDSQADRTRLLKRLQSFKFYFFITPSDKMTDKELQCDL